MLSVPPMLLSQWFPMDLPFLYSMGAHLREWLPWIASPYNGSGRYFPIYWIYYSLQYLIFGNAVWPYFLVQSVIFLASAILTARILQRMTGELRAAALLFLFIYINSPIAENLTTLGKAEPLAYFFIICIISIFHESNLRIVSALARSVVISILFALALLTKETSLALLGFAATGLIASFAIDKFGWAQPDSAPTRSYAFLLCALLIGLGIAKAPYLIFTAKTNATTYTDYAITSKLVLDNFAFYATQQPDVLLFGIFAVAFLFRARKQLLFNGAAFHPHTARNFIFAVSLCAMAWAYYLALLIWRWPMAYYMLLPGIIFKLCALYGIYAGLQRHLISGLVYKATAWIMVSVLVYSGFYVYYIGISQVAYSRIYTDALKKYKHAAGNNSSLVLESYPFFSEQLGGTQYLLREQLNTSPNVSAISDVLNPAVLKPPEMLQLLNVTQAMIDENVKSLPRTGDYLLAFTGHKLATWFLRGVTPYYNDDSFMKKEGMYDMELVAEQEIVTPAIFPHVWTLLPSAGGTSVGYKLYRVLEDKPKYIWKNRYPDGWVGSNSSLLVNSTYGRPVLVKLSVPAFALPSTIKITKDGILIYEITITDANEVVLNLGESPHDSTLIQFDIPKTVTPKSVLKFNTDDRSLGARLSLIQSASSNK